MTLNPVAVNYTTGNSTGTANSACPGDYVTTAGTLNFVPGETTKVVRVQLLGCGVVEALHSFPFTLRVNPNILRALERRINTWRTLNGRRRAQAIARP